MGKAIVCFSIVPSTCTALNNSQGMADKGSAPLELTMEQRDTMQNNTIQNKHVVINSLSMWHSLQNRCYFLYKSVGGGAGEADVH